MQKNTVLSIQGLSKQYPNGNVAVDAVSLSLQKGEVFGILGPNGSGKTTTILMILGLTEPTAGTIDILGLDPLRSPLQVKRQVGYMPDTVGFYDDMTAFENLDYTAKFLQFDVSQREKRINEALEKMGLEKRKHDRVRTFSHGMKQRLGLAEVLVKQPSIAILDEPTQGLDPQSVSEFLELILSLKRDEGITVLLSSHQLNEVQSICDRVGLFSHGRMELCGTLNELSSQLFGGDYETTMRIGDGDLAPIAQNIPSVTHVEQLGKGLYHITSKEEVRPALVRAAVEAGIEIFEISTHVHSLDEIYQAYFKEVDHAA